LQTELDAVKWVDNIFASSSSGTICFSNVAFLEKNSWSRNHSCNRHGNRFLTFLFPDAIKAKPSTYSSDS